MPTDPASNGWPRDTLRCWDLLFRQRLSAMQAGHTEESQQAKPTDQPTNG